MSVEIAELYGMKVVVDSWRKSMIHEHLNLGDVDREDVFDG